METHIRNNRKRVHLKLKNTKHGAEKGVKILQTSSQKSMRKNGANKGGALPEKKRGLAESAEAPGGTQDILWKKTFRMETN